MQLCSSTIHKYNVEILLRLRDSALNVGDVYILEHGCHILAMTHVGRKY